MNCSKCGTELRDGAKFCSACGNVTEDQSQQGSYQQPSNAQQGSYQQPSNAQQGSYQQQPNNAQQGSYQQPNQPQGGYQQNGYQQPNNAQQGGYQQQPNQNQGGYQQQPHQSQQGAGAPTIGNEEDLTHEFDPQDIKQNKDICILAYLSILFLIPLLSQPNSQYVKFHCSQGITLFILSCASGMVSFIPYVGGIISMLAGICVLIGIIFGIINTVNGRAKELPLIGKVRMFK